MQDNDVKSGERLLSRRLVGQRYNGMCARTITRWVEDPRLGFPQPLIMNDRWFFRESELESFERRLATESRRRLAPKQSAARRPEAPLEIKRGEEIREQPLPGLGRG